MTTRNPSTTETNASPEPGQRGLGYFVLPLTVLVAGVMLSIVLADQFRRNSEARDRDRFERLVDVDLANIAARLESYIAMLRGTAGIMTANPDLTRDQFRVFVERLRLTELYPGAQGIGFARWFPRSELPRIEDFLTREYGRDIAVRPAEARDDYSAILFLKPLDRRNEEAIGFDMYSEPVRREAMARARDEGRAVMSGRVRLVQEIDKDVQPGFLIYIPVFATPTIPQTIDERRAHLLGWAYSPFRTHDLFRNIIVGIPDGATQLTFAVYDGTTLSPDNLLYRTESLRGDAPLSATRTLDLAGRTWTVDFATSTAFDAFSNRMFALYVLLGGLLTTLLLSGALLLQARARLAAETARADLQITNAELETQVERVQQRTADLREANNEIQRFAYIVSHDLRSPLVNIMGFTTELEAMRADMFERLAALRPAGDSDGQAKDDVLARDFDEAVTFIKTSIGKMDRLINSILKLSREGRREFRPEYIDMKQLFRGIADGQAHKAAELEAEIDIGDVPPAFSDRLALEQIFSNLVDNALKYLQDGRPGRIRIRGRSTPATVIYEVEDNGRGIASEDHDRIFDLFRRAGPQDRPGEGIGLAHVRALVRRLGGQMNLRSAIGEGSTFTVSLPRRWMGEQEIDERTTA